MDYCDQETKKSRHSLNLTEGYRKGVCAMAPCFHAAFVVGQS